jgi:hypothetical protein
MVRKGAYRVKCKNLREGDHLRNQDVDGMIILKWILEKRVAKAQT